MVVFHHVTQNFTNFSAELLGYFKLGSYGVDLFFVLSGWLIGGLYWRERKEFGNVQIFRFWCRRWLRTLPPYFVILLFAYLSVYFYRAEKFDLRYLFFLQNYSEEMPFFLVSWSLAVEEHFYLLLPIVLGLLFALRINVALALLGLVILSMSARLLDDSAVPGSPFGYSQTASHLHFSGLMLGVLLAYLRSTHQWLWQFLITNSVLPLILFLALFMLVPIMGESYRYYLSNNVAVILSSLLLLFSQGNRKLWCSSSLLIKRIALSSYSIYLTHAMVINAFLIVSRKTDTRYFVLTPLLLVMIFVVGWITFLAIEKTSLTLREKLVRRRTQKV